MIFKDADQALSPSDRRTSDRKKLIIDVKFEGGDGTGIANTRDIGIGGLYMTTSTDLSIGDFIFMSMRLSAHEFAVRGTVVYVDPGHGVGVRFSDLTTEQEAVLRDELGLA